MLAQVCLHPVAFRIDFFSWGRAAPRVRAPIPPHAVHQALGARPAVFSRGVPVAARVRPVALGSAGRGALVVLAADETPKAGAELSWPKARALET